MTLLRTNYGKTEVCGRYETYPKTEEDKEGGLRTKGVYKEDTEETPLITYITVVYNRADTLERCMKSVWGQTYKNVEYIIIDGNSTDGTLKLIEENADKIDYYISQPDTGIYNAMNKGIALARGRFLCFMNSDDECTLTAAQKVVEEYKRTNADIICGIRNLFMNGQRVEEVTYPRYCIKHSNFRYIQMFHQATYASYEVFNKIGGFDESYSLLSDWIWESAAIDAGFTIDFCNEILTNFNYDGASFKGIMTKDSEWITWTMKTFQGMSKDDAELFVYSIDRDRHPMFSLTTLNKVAVNYQDNLVFQKAYYEDALMACIEACIDIDRLLEKVDYNIERAFFRAKIADKDQLKKYRDLFGWLDEKLKSSISKEGVDLFHTEIQTMNKLEKIRDFQVKVLCKLNRKKDFSKFKMRVFWKNSYLEASRCAGKSVELSRKFYPSVRARWNLD